MFANVKIGEREIPMKAMASVDYLYWQVFHEDPIQLQTRDNFGAGEQINFTMKMGFIMAMLAAGDRKSVSSMNEESYLDWLDQFERIDYLNAVGDIRLVYEGQFASGADAKKKDAEPTAS